MIASREDGVGPKNRLLATLLAEDAARLGPQLAAVPLPQGRVPSDVGGPLARVYFPQRGGVSVARLFEDGTAAEMATVGNEGAAGFGALLGGADAIARSVVQVPGFALATPSR